MNAVPENFSEIDRDRFLPIKPDKTLYAEIMETHSVSPNQVVSDPMTFAEAMNVTLRGGMIRRLEWPRPTVVVRIIDSRLMIHLDDGLYHPLTVSVDDLLGEDWVRVLE